MKYQMKYLLILVAILVSFSACKKDEIDIVKKEVVYETKLMNIDLVGVVVDDAGLPIKDVEVKIDSHTAMTNEKGIYHFNSVDVYGPRGSISFKHNAYFALHKSPQFEDNANVQLDVVLVTLDNPGMVVSGQGGEVLTSSGLKLIFPSDGFVDGNGNVYNGEVSVFTYYLDPAKNDIEKKFTSDFEIINKNNEIKIMSVFSSISVELYGSSNQKLQISKKVSVEFPLSDAMLSQAPSTVSLGHFDEVDKIWKEDGSATLVNGKYVGEVSHFSSWCCLVMQDPTHLYGSVFETLNGEPFGTPVADLFVKISVNNGLSSYTRTLNNGSFYMRVPKNEELVLEVYANSFDDECGDVIYTETIPALSDYLFMNTIEIEAPEMITIKGNVTDCDGQNMSSGYIIIKNSEDHLNVVYIKEDGSFKVSFYSCDDVLSATAYSDDFSFMSETFSIPSATIDVDLGTIMACEVVSTLPYFIRVITGGDTLIGSFNVPGNYEYTDGVLSNYWGYTNKIDIKNTSQPVNEGYQSSLIVLDGCTADQFEVTIPLKDDVSNSYAIRTGINNSPAPYINLYNCIDGAEYLHFEVLGILSADFVTVEHRDSLAYVDLYLPLE